MQHPAVAAVRDMDVVILDHENGGSRRLLGHNRDLPSAPVAAIPSTHSNNGQTSHKGIRGTSETEVPSHRRIAVGLSRLRAERRIPDTVTGTDHVSTFFECCVVITAARPRGGDNTEERWTGCLTSFSFSRP